MARQLQVGDLVRFDQAALGDPATLYRVAAPADQHGRVLIEATTGRGAWRAQPATLVLVEAAP
jgi:hypothetical protein